MGEKSQIKTCESLNFLQKRSVANCVLKADPLHTAAELWPSACLSLSHQEPDFLIPRCPKNLLSTSTNLILMPPYLNVSMKLSNLPGLWDTVSSALVPHSRGSLSSVFLAPGIAMTKGAYSKGVYLKNLLWPTPCVWSRRKKYDSVIRSHKGALG